MLYKNDEPYKLAENDIKTLVNRFHKWPLTITYPPERVVKSRSPQNKLPDKPNSMSWPLTATVKTTKGTESWRYAENVILRPNGVKKYTPKNLLFKGHLQLQETDVELAWFLYTKSTYCKGGLNQGKTVKFVFEDKITEAEIKAKIETQRTNIKSLIYGTETGLSEDRIRAIAKAYFIKNVDDLTFAQTKLALEHAINRDGSGGYQKFIEMTQMDELIKTRMRMQNLIDSGKLRYESGKKEWQWADGDKKVETICKVPPGTVPNDILYDFFMGNKEFQDVVESVEKTVKKK